MSRATLATAVLALSTAACGSDEPIRIGLAGPVREPRGISMERGARLAVEEINRNGGVDGRMVELVVRDDNGTEQKAIEVAEELRGMSDIVAVIGHLNSGPTIVAGLVYGAGDDPVVAISPSASNPRITRTGPWMYRVCPTDDEHGGAIARYVSSTLRRRHVAAIYLNDAYGRGVFSAFRTEFEKQPGATITSYPVLPGADPAVVAEHLTQVSGAEVIVLATDRATATPILRELRARNVRLPILGGDGLTGIEAEGAIAEDVHVSAPYLAQRSGQANADFVRAFAAAYENAVPDHRAAGAYDAAHLLARVIGEVGSGRDAIRRGLDRVTGDAAFAGVTGSIQFDANGDVVQKPVAIGVIRGGRLQLATGQ